MSRFFAHEAAGGILLMLAALAAMFLANSPLGAAYQHLFEVKLTVKIGTVGLSKALILWINDGLMAVFFFLIGLELKRELLVGKLRNRRDVVLPGMAALGGMVVPALIYAGLNWTNPATLSGWAIPAATDIAFALGVLALLGKNAPPSLKLFLLTLAILDDLGAILIIALFYTEALQPLWLLGALLPIAGLFLAHRMKTRRIAPIVLLGMILWVMVLNSGVHATLAGVITAFFVPLEDRHGDSPLLRLGHDLAPYVNFLILPLFAFANAGVLLTGMTLSALAAPVPAGVALGLVVGKLIGVLGMVALLVRVRVAPLPVGANWLHMLGVSLLAGIGFTMSLFIGSLSFADLSLMNDVRLGVLVASLVAAVSGYIVLRAAGPGAG